MSPREQFAKLLLTNGMIVFDGFYGSKLPLVRRLALRVKTRALVSHDRCLNDEIRIRSMKL